MRDPHVVSITYRLAVVSEGHSFKEPPPVERQTREFSMRLADEVVTFEMTKHCASEAEARGTVEPFLRAWEIAEGLRRRVPLIRFDFVASEIVDRNPPPPGSVKILGAVAVVAGATVTASLSIESGIYPDPPADFAVDGEVETLWGRWVRYRAGLEPLQTMAYFCLTVLEMHGGRAMAARRFSISSKVLSKIAMLSTEAGDPETARKATAKMRPITAAESAWLEAALIKIIRRVGEVAADRNAERKSITMADLPDLN
jgi:hypothetical protein